MTVNQQTPFAEYTGNGVTTDFPFNWTQQEEGDMRVTLNGSEIQRNVGYVLQNFDPESGGVVVIDPPITSEDNLFIERITPITQQLDYLENQRFPAETHEEQMDKDTLILQELITGVRLFGGAVNLAAVQNPSTVVITNTAGEDATIPLWDCVNPLAGAFAGEITTNAPTDGAVVSQPDGYIWFETA